MAIPKENDVEENQSRESIEYNSGSSSPKYALYSLK